MKKAVLVNANAVENLESDVRGKTEITRDELLKAGIRLFSQQGYEATSTRQIETEAGVQRNLMTYHFRSKEEFWKACMSKLNTRMSAILEPAVDQSRDIEPRERIRFLIRRYVRACAEVPEMSRIILDEGRSDTWRLRWFVDHYSRNFYSIVRRLFRNAKDEGMAPDIPFPNFYYILVAGGSIFSVSAECELLTGQNPLSEEMVDIHADVIANLLTNKKT